MQRKRWAVVSENPSLPLRERCVTEALERSAAYPWKTWPVVVTTEHPSKDGKRPWSVQIRVVPIEQDERTIIDVALAAWKRDAPHPIDLEPADFVLRHDGGIVYLLVRRSA